jgi:hypothetical protein
MNKKGEALKDYLNTDAYTNIQDGHEHFYENFIEWLSNKYIISKQNKFSNAYILKQKMMNYLSIEGNTVEGFWKEINI